MAALPFGRKLSLGSRGNDVKAVKRALARAGFGPKKLAGLTGVFGPFTRIFLCRFERARRNSVDGIYGPGDHFKLTPFFDALSRQLYMSTQPPIYTNPFKRAIGLVPERTDQGVDFGAKAGSPILAIGRSRITRATTTSDWPGPYGSASGFGGTGGCVQGVLLDGSHAGEEWYCAEYLYVDVVVGQVVTTGQVIGRFYHDASSRVGIEYGWVKRGTDSPCSSDTSGRPTEGGIRMTRWLEQLGCPTAQHFGPGPTNCPC